MTSSPPPSVTEPTQVKPVDSIEELEQRLALWCAFREPMRLVNYASVRELLSASLYYIRQTLEHPAPAAVALTEDQANLYVRLNDHFPNLGQLLNVLEQEWKAAKCWSEWDESVLATQRLLHAEVSRLAERGKGR